MNGRSQFPSMRAIEMPPVQEYVQNYQGALCGYSDRELLIAMMVGQQYIKDDIKRNADCLNRHERRINKNTNLIGGFFIALAIVGAILGLLTYIQG